METIITVFGLIVLGILALTVFGMTIGKKDREDFDALARYVDTCPRTPMNRAICWDEFFRLYENGFIPGEDLEELRVRMIAKFK